MVTTALSDDQRLLLEIVLEHFQATAEWPELADVQRKLIRKTGRSIDVLTLFGGLATEEDRGLWSHLQNQALLNVRLLALAGADEEVSDFLSVLKLAVKKYFEDDEKPSVSSAEVEAALGVDEKRLRKLEQVFRLEPNVLGGGGSQGAPYSWQYGVSDQVHHFKSVETVADYLAAKDALRHRPIDSVVLAPPLRGRGRSPASPGSSLSSDRGPTRALEGFHGDVIAAAAALFANQHYEQAIFDAFKAVEVRIRKLTGLQSSGQKLVGAAFGGTPPRIMLTTASGQVGIDEHEGFRLLFLGALQGIRNPKGHAFLPIEDPQACLELLALASLLLRRLDLASDQPPPEE